MRLGAKRILARDAELTITGREHISVSGPCVLVAHHYHHLLDGCALYAATDRDVHIVVGLDWAGTGLRRRGMETLCRMAGWPVIVRPDALVRGTAPSKRRAEGQRLMREAFRSSVDLLAAGELVVMFPEGYPVIDPHGSPKQESGATFLPFQLGVVRLVRVAEAAGATGIPLIPVGFSYERCADERWRVAMRAGEPHWRADHGSDVSCLAALEASVRKLSASTDPPRN